MEIRFSGAAWYRGPSDKVTEIFDREMKPANTVGINYGQSCFVLSGADADTFYKNMFGIDLPEELKTMSDEEACQAIDANPNKYKGIVKADDSLNLKFEYELLDYYYDVENNGRDAEGNPVKKVNFFLGESE